MAFWKKIVALFCTAYGCINIPPRVQIYASGVVRCYCSTAFYGISCTLNVETGVVELDQEDKKEIEAFFALYKSQNSTSKLSLGFQLLVIMSFVIQIEFTHLKATKEEDSRGRRLKRRRSSRGEMKRKAVINIGCNLVYKCNAIIQCL